LAKKLEFCDIWDKRPEGPKGPSIKGKGQRENETFWFDLCAYSLAMQGLT
jgi:hypothetical protein